MNRRIFLNAATLTTVALLLGVGLSATAQGRGGGRGGFGGPGGGPMGAMMAQMRTSRSLTDPGISSETILLARPDVRNELYLNGRQTEALDNLQSDFPNQMREQMRTTFQKMRQDNAGVDPRQMTPDERQAYQQQMQETRQEAMTALQADQDKKAEQILTDKQRERLQQLDLQWRGPLALADTKVADKLNLTPEQRTKFTALLKEYRDAQRTAQRDVMGGGRQRNRGVRGGNADGTNPTDPNAPNAQAQNTPPPAGGADPAAQAGPGFGARGFTPPTPEEMQARMDTLTKTMDKTRKATEEKALALLTSEQLQQWKALQGKSFIFRTNAS